MARRARRIVHGILAAAAAWTGLNCLYVYFVLGGTAAFRIESAALIFAILAVAFTLAHGRIRQNEPGTAATEGRDAVDAAVKGTSFATLALAAAWLAVFVPLLSFPFLSDDYGFLASYRQLRDAVHPFEFFRPAFAALFAALGQWGSGSPVPFHAASFALHLACAACVYALASRLSRGPALVAAAVFLFNPAQGEAVLWASGLQEVLWTFFMLAALVCYTGARAVTGARIAATGGLVALALASKETAICALPLLVAVDGLAYDFRRGRGLWRAYLVVLVETLAYVIVRSRFVRTDSAFFVAPSRYFWKQMLVIPYEVFVHPWNRAAYAVPPAVVCCAALMLLLIVWLRAREATPSSLLGPVWIALSILPVYSLFYVGPDLAGSRYLYFAAAGFGLLVADTIGAIPGVRRHAIAATGALSAALLASLLLNLQPWREAADLVAEIESTVSAGEGPTDAIALWQSQHPPGLVLRNGVPDSYQGVWVFRNGYDDFVKRLAER